MAVEMIELYIELINGLIGTLLFLITLSVFNVAVNNPELIRGYFFLKAGNISKPFFYFMMGMLVWGIRELYKVLELQDILKIELFYEITETISALLLLYGMIYFYKITKSKKITEQI